jgi:hypothetical protein
MLGGASKRNMLVFATLRYLPSSTYNFLGHTFL